MAQLTEDKGDGVKARKLTALESYIEEAAEKLPEGDVIRIIIERGSAFVEVDTKEYIAQMIYNDEGALAEAVEEALDFALSE